MSEAPVKWWQSNRFAKRNDHLNMFVMMVMCNLFIPQTVQEQRRRSVLKAVRLLVCQYDYTKTSQLNFMSLGTEVEHGPRKNRLVWAEVQLTFHKIAKCALGRGSLSTLLVHGLLKTRINPTASTDVFHSSLISSLWQRNWITCNYSKCLEE